MKPSSRLGGPRPYRCTDAHPAASECPEAPVPLEGCQTPATTSSPAGPRRRWDPLNTRKVGIKWIKEVVVDGRQDGGERTRAGRRPTCKAFLGGRGGFLCIKSVIPFHGSSSNIKDEFSRVCGSSVCYSGPHSGPASPFSSDGLESANEQLHSEFLAST